ncbi:MAG: ATP-binding protein, partial [Ignavibacteria bacterium]|nr:ATP-binding protein [Ignavibacteria bacterium]
AMDYDNPFDLVEEIKQYTIKDGLSDNTIKSILEDENGNLWLGSNSGLSFFEINSNSFTNFNESDGLTGDDLNLSSALKTEDNFMFWGSTTGIILFEPNQIKSSTFIPNIVFTEFQVFNEDVKAGTGSPLAQNISFAKEIRLSHSQNVFSLQFAALDYNSSNTIHYAYKMEGFDKDWIYSGSRRFVTYTNLNSGSYLFKVKATNSDGVWSDKVKEILIVIEPPWWRTIWAYVLYLVIIFVGLILIRRTELNRTRLRNELRIREIEAEKLRELEKIKSRFFANLSHEFRTPLMLIKGPVEQLLSGKEINQEEQIRLIERNSEKLQYLIDQLLELTQLESNSIFLKAKKANLIPIVKGIFYSFSSLAEQKIISLRYNSTGDRIFAWIDRDKFEKILNNLLSNAFKFTSENGNISVSISTDITAGKEIALVSVRDTGIGIPKDNIDKIFDRFYQVDDSSRRAYSGSGIGLSLVQELVDLHKWEIKVKSELGVGTEFILQIPLDDNYLNENQKVKDNTKAADDKFEKNEEHHSIAE